MNQPGQSTAPPPAGASAAPAFDAQAMANLYQRMMSVAQGGGFMGMGMMGMPAMGMGRGMGMGNMGGGMGNGMMGNGMGMGMGGMGQMGGGMMGQVRQSSSLLFPSANENELP